MSLTSVRGVTVLFCVINVSTLNSSRVSEEEACSLLSHVFLRERVFHVCGCDLNECKTFLQLLHSISLFWLDLNGWRLSGKMYQRTVNQFGLSQLGPVDFQTVSFPSC